MKAAEGIGILCRVATARMPTKWGMFNAAGFERAAKGTSRIDTALTMIMGDVRGEAPLLRIHSQCFTGEGLGSLRCDCSARQNSVRGESEPVLAAVSAHQKGKDGPRAEPSTSRRHRSDKRPARARSDESTRVALDLNLIKRRADYVNH